MNTTIRNNLGRCCVQIPFKGDICDLSESKDSAFRRFLSLERHLSVKSEMRSQYIQFMKEYEELGHIKEITTTEANSSKAYYILHPAVLREDSTTKLQVVFDTSSKTNSGVSLNDNSIVSQTVQSNFVSIVSRFRTHPYIVTADIEKMFCQINIQSAQQNLQVIFWRDQPKDPTKTFKLLTITYGTASAPYLATRTIKQLALDEESSFPVASIVVVEDFYVDDVITGAKTIKEAKKLWRDLNDLLQRGSFHLRKWSTNNPDILSNVPLKDVVKGCIEIDQDTTIKTPGLMWNPRQDVFQLYFCEKTQL
ncbi:uncharacterized protein LOC142329547 [Lycorma delicatula]|uniref:uncharacterized protein LOC142329547 n=1 Tax=Lycorma delicatula TaxID=130591 RepID=UPI003F519587